MQEASKLHREFIQSAHQRWGLRDDMGRAFSKREYRSRSDADDQQPRQARHGPARSRCRMAPDELDERIDQHRKHKGDDEGHQDNPQIIEQR